MLSINRHSIYSTLLAIAVLLETLSLTYMQDEGNKYYYTSSILYFLCGIFIAIIPVFYVPFENATFTPKLKLNRGFAALCWTFLLALLVYNVVILMKVFKSWPIDRLYSDMLLYIKLADHRFLTGQTIYKPAPEVWGGNQNFIPYLPMMWIPYLPAEILNFDMRWCTFFVAFAPLFLLPGHFFQREAEVPFFPLIISGLSLFLLFNFYLMKDAGFWACTEEGITGGFYLCLSYFLLRKNYIFTGILITCALLTRPALLLWIPSFFVFIFCTQAVKNSARMFFFSSVLFLGLFFLPFFIKDPAFFIGLPGAYASTFKGLWLNGGGIENRHFCVGLFKFFSVSQINLMIQLQVITSFGVPAIFLFMIWWFKKKRIALNEHYVAYASLKLSLVFFYAFLAAPLRYLFFPGALISYAVLFDFLATNKIKESAANLS